METIGKIFKGRVEFSGVGGQCMEKAGLKKLFSINELSIIGIWEVVSKVFHLKKLIAETVQKIFDYQPDVVVTIDSSGFTHRVAKKIKKNDCQIPIVHYVAPPVWAWRGWRAKSMPKFIDKIMTLFPFEPTYFEKYGLKSVFVGHPIAEDVDFDRPHRSRLQNFLNSSCKIKEKDDYKIITLLPGSRKSEIVLHLPLLEEFAKLIVHKYKNVKFIIPTVENLEKEINDMTCGWLQKPIIVTTKAQKVLAYYTSDVAVAASGSVTLELARVGLPFVTIYKTSRITYLIIKFLINVKNVCLVNLLSKKNIVPELLQKDCTPENVFNSVKKILNSNECEKQRELFKKVMKILKGDKELAARETILMALEKSIY
jgi:lipid-A-disaccharide synthase